MQHMMSEWLFSNKIIVIEYADNANCGLIHSLCNNIYALFTRKYNWSKIVTGLGEQKASSAPPTFHLGEPEEQKCPL